MLETEGKFLYSILLEIRKTVNCIVLIIDLVDKINSYFAFILFYFILLFYTSLSTLIV